jgi:flagellar export protein FliJ
MAFPFPLQAVFHFRQSIEHQQELRLRAANQQMSRARHRVEQIDARIEEVRTHQSRELGTGTTAAKLRFALQCEGALLHQRQAMQRELQHLQNLRDEQQKIFQQARRERETFESLRDGQLRDYTRDATCREQRQVDDLYSSASSLLAPGYEARARRRST